MNLNRVPVGPEDIQVASHSAGTGQLSDQVQLQGGCHLRYVPLALSCWVNLEAGLSSYLFSCEVSTFSLYSKSIYPVKYTRSSCTAVK